MTVYFDNIPKQLKQVPQWLVHGANKAPLLPSTGNGTGWNKAKETYKAARTAYRAHPDRYKGVGLNITPSTGIIAVDLDGVRDATTGVLDPIAARIIEMLKTYTEISFSGSGVHCFLLAPDYDLNSDKLGKTKITLPENGIESATHNRAIFENYNSKFMSITGNTGDFEPRSVEVRSRELREVRDYIAELTQKPDSRPTVVQEPRAAVIPEYTADKSDEEYINIGLEKDPVFEAYYEGARPDGDESANDLGLFNKLAYWSNCNVGLMESYFRKSPHAQSKSAEHMKKLERADYIPRTIKRAIDDLRETARERDETYNTDRAAAKTKKKPAQPIAEPKLQEVSAQLLKRITEIDPYHKPRDYTRDDMGFCKLFAETVRELARYCEDRGQWYTYNQNAGIWEPGETRVGSLAKKFMDALGVYAIQLTASDTMTDADADACAKYGEDVNRRRQCKHRQTLVYDAKTEPILRVKAKSFDRQPLYFNCKNGTLDLETEEFRAHRAADLLTQRANVSYDPEAEYPRFNSFLKQVTMDRADVELYLKTVMGYCITGQTQEECFFLSYGSTTRNGKDTLFTSFSNMMGTYSAAAKAVTFSTGMNKAGGGPSEDIARLAGKRFVLVNEPADNLTLSSDLIKELTGNSIITARELYKGSFEFIPTLKLMMCSNYRPAINDHTVFASDRVKVIPWDRHFTPEEQDKTLKAQFETETAKSSVLNWAIEGYREYKKRSLTVIPQAVRIETEAYRAENDKIALFVSEKLRPAAGSGYITTAEMYKSYKNWCIVNGHRGVENKKNFLSKFERFEKCGRRRRPGADRGSNALSCFIDYAFIDSFEYESPAMTGSGSTGVEFFTRMN